MTPRNLPPRRRQSDASKDDPVTLVDIWKAIAKYGLPTAILLPLLYLQVVESRANQTKIFDTQTQIITEQRSLGAAILKLSERVGEQHNMSEQILLVLRVTCMNAADPVSERNQCLREQ